MASVVNATANYSFVNISGNFQINLKRSDGILRGLEKLIYEKKLEAENLKTTKIIADNY